MTSKSFDELSDEMLKAFLRTNPDAGTAIGIHEPYDWQLPHGGFKRLEDTLAILELWHRKASRLARSEKLDIDQKTGIKALRTAKDVLRFSIEDYPIWKMYPDTFEWFGGLLFMMLTRDYAPYDQRVSAICSRLGSLPEYLKQFRTRFKDPNPVHVWTRTAISVCGNTPGFLRVIEESSRGRVSSSLQEDLRERVKEATTAIDEHLGWLKEMLALPERDFPIGRIRFAKLLKIRGISPTADEILALGEIPQGIQGGKGPSCREDCARQRS